jgi:hypothetical protein
MLLAGFATAAVPLLTQAAEARPLPATTGAVIAGEAPVTQIRSRRDARNAAIAGAVALGAIGAIAAARSQPYAYGPAYGYAPSYAYEPAYGHAPVYDHGYAPGYVTGYAPVVSGYDYAQGYGNGGYYDLPGDYDFGYGHGPSPVVVQRGVRYPPPRRFDPRWDHGYETGFNR